MSRRCHWEVLIVKEKGGVDVGKLSPGRHGVNRKTEQKRLRSYSALGELIFFPGTIETKTPDNLPYHEASLIGGTGTEKRD